jgi:hypothetical protein
MAIPRNIDLTERGDFSNGVLAPQIESLSSDMEIRDLFSFQCMSNADYEKLQRYERFFGRKWHYTDYLDVFREDESEWIERSKCHCARCGKEIRIPWKRYGGLCYNCDSIFESRALPWQSPLSVDMDNGYDLFNLR